ncbi:ATP-binding protein [Mechercharimyces sp. CAU 1602]|uniref:ATP-binding protein n=1 Tax=Mechercharimyces sp. CAU 1602 TaxID=2973933 RepID=UPI00216253FA|nr:ATP-binding protein [Mechercharimyces sp. CAU 1602]MCS1351177.1 ATP-binding protein [Mechercharimyces sp. CAU 1602]
MKSIAPMMEQLQARVEALKQKKRDRDTTTSSTDSSGTKCPTCKGMGYLLDPDDRWKYLGQCECSIREQAKQRLHAAMIPDEFKEAWFDQYKVSNGAQKTLYNASQEYLRDFPKLLQDKNEHRRSIGFIAKFGEQRMKSIKNLSERREKKKQHNNYGLGKTHLQVAMAKDLIAKGRRVLIISDVLFMDELMQSKMIGDGGVEMNRILGLVTRVPVLVWDDIGKSNPTESKQSMYFQIINERYKSKLPIIYSSNEDSETLEERIGGGATSRLFGMSHGRIYPVQGPDYRLWGGK